MTLEVGVPPHEKQSADEQNAHVTTSSDPQQAEVFVTQPLGRRLLDAAQRAPLTLIGPGLPAVCASSNSGRLPSKERRIIGNLSLR
jgi:hypothetical protein